MNAGQGPGPLADVIAGARPNVMKIAPILHAIQRRQAQGSALRYRLVHTGQHYDARMSGDCFTQRGTPEPDMNLEVGSGTQAERMPRLRPPPFWAAHALRPDGYFVMTVHRPANVDDPAAFARLLSAVCNGARGLPVVFPVHPRTAKTLRGLAERWPGLLEPQPSLEFKDLLRHAKGVMTDSGGVTEEPTVMGVPCMTLRDSTERPETVPLGTNALIGSNPAALKPRLDRMFDGQWKRGSIPEKWGGHTGERIAQQLDRLLAG